MHRGHARLAAAAALIGSFALAGCATESYGVDVSGGLPHAAPEDTHAESEDPSLLVFGDSWTYGMAATTPTGGYAYLAGESLGWDTTVDGENGSGYLRPGELGGVYGTRVLQLDPELEPDVIVIQGSINDRGADLDGLSASAHAVWRALETRYPDAELVVLGPAPSVLPVDAAVRKIDTILNRLANVEGVTYISPLTEQWITEDNFAKVIDTSSKSRNHPSDSGHEYLAERLAEELEAIELTADGS